MARPVLITPGQRFGRLTVLAQHPERTRAGGIRWACRCDCGATRVIVSYALRNRTRSCGCLQKERTTKHGLSSRPEYASWAAMHRRCGVPSAGNYPIYGGRGITVCPEWGSFERFYADMGPRPTMGHTLDRIDNNGPYSKDNCAWRTRKEQNRNTRSSRLLTFDGRTMTVAAWAEEVGIERMVLHNRIRRGWTVERTLTEPCQEYQRREKRDEC